MIVFIKKTGLSGVREVVVATVFGYGVGLRCCGKIDCCAG